MKIRSDYHNMTIYDKIIIAFSHIVLVANEVYTMDNNKPWYEKMNIWTAIIASICTILGVSIFGDKSLVKDNDDLDATAKIDNNKNIENEPPTSNNKDNFLDNNKKDEKQDENNFPEDNINEEKVSPFITSDPKASAVIHVNLTNWTEDDKDIFGRNYTGTNTMKLSVYNMIDAIGGGSDDITAEIHMPFGERFDATWVINFVVMRDMVGNGSYANITILSGDQELYPAFTMKSDTTDKMEYEINLKGIRDLVIRFECHAVDSGFCSGIIFTGK